MSSSRDHGKYETKTGVSVHNRNNLNMTKTKHPFVYALQQSMSKSLGGNAALIAVADVALITMAETVTNNLYCYSTYFYSDLWASPFILHSQYIWR